MIDIKQINIALKVAGDEYIRIHPKVYPLDNIHKLLDLNKDMFHEIIESSEHYLSKTIKDPKILDESIGWLRSHMKLDEQHCKQQSLNSYMTVWNHLN